MFLNSYFSQTTSDLGLLKDNSFNFFSTGFMLSPESQVAINSKILLNSFFLADLLLLSYQIILPPVLPTLLCASPQKSFVSSHGIPQVKSFFLGRSKKYLPSFY